MLYVALSSLVVLALVIALYSGTLRSQSRAHARREDLLLNQLLNLAGKPWQPAPAEKIIPSSPTWEDVLESSRYQDFTLSPEQEPV